MDKLAENVACRKVLEEVLEYVGEQPHRFWELILEKAQSKLPKKERELPQSMREKEAIEFEESLMPYGQFKGEKIWNIRPSYLTWLAEGDGFTSDLKRYVRSERFSQRLKQEEQEEFDDTQV